MKQFFAFPIACLLSSSLSAQCGSSWNVGSYWGCSVPAPSTTVQRLSGGSPPFNITLFAGTSSTVLGSFTGVVSTIPPTAPITQPFRAVITDVNGCVQTVNCSVFTTAPTSNPIVSAIVPVDPETGIGGFSISTGQIFSFNGSCWFARVLQSGNTILQTQNASNWALDPFLGLAPGTYQVDYGNQPCPGSYISGWIDYSYISTISSPWTQSVHSAFCGRSHSVVIPALASDPNPVRLPIKLLLEGPYDQASGLMSDALRTNGKLPWNNTDNVTRPNTRMNMDPVSRAVSGNNAYVDWVQVQLRDATNPATIVYSRMALVQRDGDLVMQNGQGPLSCNVAAGNYYVVVKHRNHLGVMTAAPVTLGLSTALVDFTNTATVTYGVNAQKQVGTRMVMWAGDATANGSLQYTGLNNDRDPILTAIGSTTPNNVLTNIYNNWDTNMDGVIRYVGANNDRDPILTNVGSTTPNNTRTQQLP